MAITAFVQTLVNGLAIGGSYSLIAVGFCLVYSIMKFTNFAHGSMISAAAFVSYWVCNRFNLGLLGSLFAAIAAGALIGSVTEFLAFRRIEKKSASNFYFFVSSLTWGTLVEQLVNNGVGIRALAFPKFYSSLSIKITVFGTKYTIMTNYLYMFASAVIVLGLLFVFLYKTKYGRAIRATSFDRDTANLMGINVALTIQIVLILAGIMAGVGGVFLGVKNKIYAQLGSDVVTKGFISSVIGGLGSVYGAVIGAFVLGVVEQFLVYFVGSNMARVVIFVLMLIFLLIRPQGISGIVVKDKA